MNKFRARITNHALGIVAASALFTANLAVAGPGKPGDNDIDPGGNIVEVASAANDLLGVFNTVLAAAQCDYFNGAVVDILTGTVRDIRISE